MYARLMGLRAGMYRRGALPSWRPPGFCVSVGNISWGGSGKTPLCEWLLQWGAERGDAPVLLSRGYKAAPPALPYAVRPDSPVGEAGDEPLLLARSCPGATVVIDPRRARGGRWAASAVGSRLFVLDDGFQHLGVRRDLDLVLLSPEDLSRDWDAVLPAGPWREPAAALGRASALLLRAGPDRFEELRLLARRRLGALAKPVFSFQIRPAGVLRVVDGIRQELARIGPYMLVSGVGRPRAVEASVAAAIGRKPELHLVFPDHHPYASRDWKEISFEAHRKECERILCTPKDAVKLARFADAGLWSLETELRFGPREPEGPAFEAWLQEAFATG
jgi:tetraacyldisaccharide 4'-kinase